MTTERSTASKRAGASAAAIFGAFALEELVRVLTNDPWTGMTALQSHAMGVSLAILWFGSAVACVTGSRRVALWPVIGAFALLPAFVVTRAGGSPLGIMFLVALPVVVSLTWLAFGRRLRLGTPQTSETMPEPQRDGENVVL